MSERGEEMASVAESAASPASGLTASETPCQSEGEPPRRVQLSRAKGWRMPPNTVKVDRSTPWGNPFRVGEARVKTAAEAVNLFTYILRGYLPLACGPEISDMRRYIAFADDHIHELRGKNLACWCRRGQPCHADVLLTLANHPSLGNDPGRAKVGRDPRGAPDAATAPGGPPSVRGEGE